MSNNYYVLRERNKWVVYKQARWWLFDRECGKFESYDEAKNWARHLFIMK